MAARILDLCGIVLNRNTIPGDPAALRSSGIRIGTPWITQRGFGDAEIDKLGDIIADVLQACVPFSYGGKKGPEPRAKIDFDAFQKAKLAVRELTRSVGIDTEAKADDYPHFYYLDSVKAQAGWTTFAIKGEQAKAFLNTALTSDVLALKAGEQQATLILEANGSVMSRGVLEAVQGGYKLHVEQDAGRVAAWLRGLSDGFVLFDTTDPYAKVPGPVDVVVEGDTNTSALRINTKSDWSKDFTGYAAKSYFVGINGDQYAGPQDDNLPLFQWEEPTGNALLTTTLHSLHKELGAKMVEFAGYDMPVWYSSVTEEHQAVRTGAGIFDVTHMGVLGVKGVGAAAFLDVMTTNEVEKLAVGESHYTYLLDQNGIPYDDLMIYRLGQENFLVVVNASNNDKNIAYLMDAQAGKIRFGDGAHGKRLPTGANLCTITDYRKGAGAAGRVDVALQGPKSTDILMLLGGSESDKAKVKKLTWAGVTQVKLGDYDLIVSRTGYTGERTAYELFVRPDQAPQLFTQLITNGATPCGLAARDSLRTEAGLPLYGHELAGPLNLNPADAGFGNYVKLWKPYFVGKKAFIQHELEREAEVTRFRLDNKGARPAHQGDPVVDKKGKVIGVVTSCCLERVGLVCGVVFVVDDYSKDGTAVGVFAGSARAKNGKAPGELSFGDKFPTPEPATILTRFPKAKK
jgi:glycine hydroxymethyltransferase